MAGDMKRLQKSYFDVLGICCSAEVGVIENILKPLEGVKEVTVIVPTRTVIVLHDHLLISQLQIVKALNQARLEANARADGETKFHKKWPSPFALACGVLLLLSFLKYVYRPLQLLALAAVAVGGWPVLRKAYASLIPNFTLDINILMIIAVAGTIGLGDYTEAGTIVFLFTTAEWLESRASHRAKAVMSKLTSIAPRKAVLADTGEEVDVDEVKLGTVLAVKAGEVIPIDGIVVDGKCEVDEKTLTGESFPVAKQQDSTVWAGTMNLNGYIGIKTSAVAEDCAVARMVKLVEEAQNSKSSTQRFIDKCSKYYTPVIMLISVSIAVIPAALRVHNHNQWLHLALVVLVSACPCALILSTPVATFCALTRAATSGVIVKGSDYLEVLSKIRIAAFDKTGTLTRGEFVVTGFKSLCPDISLDTLLFWVSSIESKSSHPVASALVEYGKSLHIEPKPELVDGYENFPGEGIYGKIDDRETYIGNRRIAERAGGAVPILEDSEKGSSSGYIFSGSVLVGTFCVSDACRTGAAEAIKELKSMGIMAAMLTGDNQAAATYVHEQLERSLAVVHSELLPEDKARIIKQLKKEGPTAMVGDGLNDGPALATADVGISMGISGSALAAETGHVILMSNDIRKIPQAFRLAKRAHNKVIQNVILSISIKAAILALAIAGHPLIWAAVLADVGTCLLVIINSMFLLHEPHSRTGKCCKSRASLCTDKGQCHSLPSHKLCDGLDKAGNMCEPHKLSTHKCASRCQAAATKLNSNGGSNTSQHYKKCCTQPCNTLVGSGAELHNVCGYYNSQCHQMSMWAKDKHSDSPEHKYAEAGNVEEKSCRAVLHVHSSLPIQGQDDTRGEIGLCQPIHHRNYEALRNFNKSETKPHPHLHDCCKDSYGPPHVAVDIPLAWDNEAMHACQRLKKREIGSCCRSDLKSKECCCNHQPSAPGFRGGLIKSVTE